MKRYSRTITVLRFVAVIVWIAVIWGHSLMSGVVSSKESMAIVALLRKVSLYFGDTDYSFLKRLMLHFGLTSFDMLEYFVRKVAHFSEHAILGILMMRALRTKVRSPFANFVLAALLCAVVPFVDELLIQTQVAGRFGSLSDVELDLCGVCFGLILALPGSVFASRRSAQN